MTDWLNERQQQAVDKLSAAGRGIVWWKIGEGKTRIALGVYFRRAVEKRGKLLVICSPQAFRQWQDEINMVNPTLSVQYLSFGVLSGARGTGWAKTIAADDTIGMVVLDELWMYKNPHSKRSYNVHIISARHPTIGLSGSFITNRNIEDLYGQSYAVGVGPRLAKSLTDFRTQFCISYEDFGLKFAPKKDALVTIQQRLAPVVDIYFPKDVRESRIQHIEVDPTREQLKLFDTCQNEYYTKFKTGQELEIRSAATLISKLLQISDGVVRTNEREIVPIQSNKFLRLTELLAEFADAGEKILVWFAFKASLDKAYAFLGAKATCLSGDKEFDNKGWREGRYTACLATIGSGASLNDFASCQFSIIYSSPFDYRAMQQALGRTNRTGSTHAVCHYYFLSTACGVDRAIYDHIATTGQFESSAIRTSIDVINKYYDQRKLPS